MVAALGQAAVVWFLPERTLAEKLLCTAIAIFILVRHKDNIERLIKGEEKPLDLK
jgi:glycerol-3-phosphate acyltransferase PlsY